MPQMMPLFWIFIAPYIFYMLLSITSFIYFFFFPSPLILFNMPKKTYNSIFWYWKW